MELSPDLVRAIESTHVAYQGLSHPLRLVGAERESPDTSASTTVKVTVESAHDGTSRRATCRFTASGLDDKRNVATALAETMREVLAGELPPDQVRDPSA